MNRFHSGQSRAGAGAFSDSNKATDMRNLDMQKDDSGDGALCLGGLWIPKFSPCVAAMLISQWSNGSHLQKHFHRT